MYKINFIALLLLPFLLTLVSNLSAEVQPDSPKYLELALNMSHADVIRLWGSPSEKQEFESRRKEIWVFGDSSVVFLNGRVTSWSSGNAMALEPKYFEAPLPARTADGSNSDPVSFASILTGLVPAVEPENPQPSKIPQIEAPDALKQLVELRKDLKALENSPEKIVEREMQREMREQEHIDRKLESAESRNVAATVGAEH